MRARTSARITTILTYILATLVICQGMIMLFPITAFKIAQDVISKDRRCRQREVELAQIFPDVWVRHVIRTEEEKKSLVAHRILVDTRGP